MTRVDWDRVTPLLERLLDLPEPRRAAWLAAECGDDTRLFRHTWRAYEDGMREDDFLASPMRGVQPAGTDEEGDGAQEPRIGPYRLVRRIGSGGMGTVWLAERDDGQFDKRVALKLVKRGMDTEAVVRRFRVERQVLADLEHPRIARLLDGGTTEEGLPYLVMEHVEGRPLLEYCEVRGLGVAERLRLFQRVCETVQFAHERQVVHRDLKPSNVLVDERGEPKLLDFGIAKVLEPWDDGTLELTRTGERFLSPRYASPEQLRGEPVGPASDVYSLGVILYELLTSRHPHGWLTTSWREFEVEVLERDPPPPSRATLQDEGSGSSAEARRARRRLRGDLDTIVLAALRKEPERRYASARALGQDIGFHLAGRPVLARPDTVAYRASKFVRRNRGLVLGTGAFVLLLLVALGLSLTLYAGSRRSTREARWQAYVGQVGAAANAISGLRVAEARDHLRLAPEELRGWEWHHLWQRLDHSRRALDVACSALCVDPDRGRLAVGGGSSLQVLDRETLGVLASLEYHSRRHIETWDTCEAVGLSPDGCLLASVWRKGDLFVQDIESRAIVVTGDLDVVHTTLAFQPGTGRIVAGLGDGRLRLLDAGSGEVLLERAGHTASVDALAIDPGSGRIASGSWDETVRLWRNDLTPLRELRGHTMGVQSVAFSPDGSRLVSSSMDGTVRVWDVETGEPLLVENPGGGVVTASIFDPSGERILSAISGGIVVWDVETRDRLATWLGHEPPSLRLAFDSSTGHVWSADGASLREWTLDTQDVRTLEVCEFTDDVAFDPKGGRFACGAPDGKIRLWSFPDAEPLGVLEGEGMVVGLAFHPHEDRLFVLDERGRHTVWDPTERRLLEIGAEAQTVGNPADFALSIDASGEHLLCLLGVVAEVRDSRSGERIWTFSESDRVFDAVLDAQGGRVVAVTRNGCPVVWDLAGEELAAHRLSEDEDEIPRVLALSLGDDLVAIGFADGRIQLRETESTRLRVEIHENTSSIGSLAFHPDGRRLASGSVDGAVRLWDVPSGRAVVTLSGHHSSVCALAFSPDGSALLSVSSDGKLRLWETAPEPVR